MLIYLRNFRTTIQVNGLEGLFIMKRFIQYNLAGEIIEQHPLDLDHPKVNPLGQKVRITVNDGKKYVGFLDTPLMVPALMNTFFKETVVNYLQISRYDLDEDSPKLRSYNSIAIFIPTAIVEKIEAILYSNPRWGSQLTNEFIFKA